MTINNEGVPGPNTYKPTKADKKKNPEFSMKFRH